MCHRGDRGGIGSTWGSATDATPLLMASSSDKSPFNSTPSIRLIPGVALVIVVAAALSCFCLTW